MSTALCTMQNSNPEIFQIGSRVVEIANDAFCLNGKERMRKIEIENAKERIVNFLKSHESFYISDLAERLSIKPLIVIAAVKELKGEGIIKDRD